MHCWKCRRIDANLALIYVSHRHVRHIACKYVWLERAVRASRHRSNDKSLAAAHDEQRRGRQWSDEKKKKMMMMTRMREMMTSESVMQNGWVLVSCVESMRQDQSVEVDASIVEFVFVQVRC